MGVHPGSSPGQAFSGTCASLGDDLSLECAACCRIARGVQRGRMLPTLRLLIAAMLATVVVLICGFGIFATFRVSHDPIAHLPTAAVPLQMVAEAGAGSGALSAARDRADPRSQFDVPMNMPQATGPAAPTVEQRDEAELADERPPAAQSPSATEDAEPSADRDTENESVASEPPGAASPPVAQSPSSQSDARGGDVAR